MPVREGLIPYQQGKGEAFIFPQQNLRNFERLTEATEREKVRKGREEAALATKRDEDIKNLFNYNIPIPRDRDKEEIEKDYTDVHSFYVDNLDEILNNPTGEKAKLANQKRRDLEVKSVTKARDWENLMSDMDMGAKIPNSSFIDKNKYLKARYAHYLDKSEDKGLSPSMFDFLNEGAFLNNFVDKNVKEFTGTTSNLVFGTRGDFIDTKEVTGKFYLVENGEIQVDAQGIPIIEVSDETASQLLLDTDWRGNVLRKLQDDENVGKTEVEYTKELLENWAYQQEKQKRTKGFAAKRKRRGFGFGEEEFFNESSLLTNVAMMFIGDLGLLQTGGDFNIQTKEGMRNLHEVESPLKFGKAFKNERGKDVNVAHMFLDPNKRGIIYVEDTDGDINEFNESNIITLITATAAATGDISLDRIEELRPFKSGVFQSDKFFRADIREQEQIRIGEVAFQKLVEGKTVKLKDVLTNVRGFFSNLVTLAGEEGDPQTNPQFAEVLQDEVFKDAKIVIDNKEYLSPKFTTDFRGNFKIIDSETGKDLTGWMTDDKLKKLFDEGDAQLKVTRKYLQRIEREEAPVPTPAPAEEIPTISTQEDYDALLSGAQYKDSRGTIATKK